MILKKIQDFLALLRSRYSVNTTTEVLDEYVSDAPNVQQTMDIFADTWLSALPEQGKPVPLGLYNDERLLWLEEQLGDLHGYRVLEIAPHEAGHSFMLEQMGAEKILAVESNTQMYLKCLTAKSLLHLQQCEFVLGDFRAYHTPVLPWNLCIAINVLQYYPDPLEIVNNLAKHAEQLFICVQDPLPTAVTAQRFRLPTASQIDATALIKTLKTQGYTHIISHCEADNTTIMLLASKQAIKGLNIEELTVNSQLATPQIDFEITDTQQLIIYWEPFDNAQGAIVYYADNPDMENKKYLWIRRTSALCVTLLSETVVYYVAVQICFLEEKTPVSPILCCRQ